MGKRIQWIDYGKGFAMFLVFWGHTICPEIVRGVFYAFHMPLFFFLSGYVFSYRRYSSIKTFIWKKFRTLIVPGAVFGTVCLIGNCLNGLFIKKPVEGTILTRVVGLFLEIRGGSYWVIPWFFTSLFTIEVVSFFFASISHSENSTFTECTLFSYWLHLLLIHWLYCALGC